MSQVKLHYDPPMMDAIPWLFVIPPALVTALGLGSLLYKRSPAGRAHRHLADGGRWLHKNELEKAEEAFRAGLKLRPNHGPLASALASLLVSQEEYAQAITLLEVARKAHPKDMTIKVLTGRCQQAMGDNEAALAIWRQIPASEDAYLDAQVLLAAHSESEGEIAQAVAHLEAGIQSASPARARPYNRELRRLKTALEAPAAS